MKYALALPILGLVLGFTSPVSAATLDGFAMKATPMTASQQDTCKEGEEWDEDEKKCKKKEG